jgi:hypothetical protein
LFGRFFLSVPKPGIWFGEGTEERYKLRPSAGRGFERRESTNRFATTFNDEFLVFV